jgi:Carboxypeptidase regulatory-like domain/TonB-dependent Receptor Plug Domain
MSIGTKLEALYSTGFPALADRDKRAGYFFVASVPPYGLITLSYLQNPGDQNLRIVWQSNASVCSGGGDALGISVRQRQISVLNRRRNMDLFPSLNPKALARIFVTLLSAAAALPSPGQTNTVTVLGAVTDHSGAVIPNVQVIATNITTGITEHALSDQTGHYILLNVDPGTYDVTTAVSGFATEIRHNQVFLVGQTVTLNFTLQVASVAQTIEVQADNTTAIPTTESVVSRVIEPHEIDDLPTISRSFSDLAALSPGVLVANATAPSDTSNAITIGDATTYQTGYMVDGTSSEESFSGGPYLNFAQDWIQEFSVISQQPTAEYGGASGGYVNAVTRSGGNDVHGRGYGYFQNAALNATPAFLPAIEPHKPQYNLERIGGMVGGPIKRDKLFYFTGYEIYHLLNSVPINITTPGFTSTAWEGADSVSGVFAQPTTYNIAIGKVDWQINSRNKIMGRFNYQYSNSQNSGIGASGNSFKTVGNGTSATNPVYMPSFHWQRTISPTKLNEVMFNFARLTNTGYCNYAQKVGDYPLFPSQPGSAIGGDPSGWWAQITYPNAGVVTGCPGNFGLGLDQSYRDASIGDTLSITHGANNIKVGVLGAIEQQRLFLVRNNYDGEFSINSTVPFLSSLATTPASVAATYPTSDLMTPAGGNGQQGNIFGYNYSFFVQDDIRATPNLTLNLGFRYYVDYLNSWMTRHNHLPFTSSLMPVDAVNNDYGDASPRFGAAWTPFHDSGRTVVRGGIGTFYDENHDGYMAVFYGNGIKAVNAFNLNATRPSLNPYCLGYVNCSTTNTVPTQQAQWVEEVLAYALSTYTLPNFNLGTYTINTPIGPQTYNIPAPTFGPPTVTGGPGTGGLAPVTGGTLNLDQNLKVPAEFQASIGVGHDFSNSFSISADFVKISGYQLIVLRAVNITQQASLLNPSFGSYTSYGNGGSFTDKSLRVMGSYHDRRGDSIRGAYSLAWAFDNAFGGFSNTSRTSPATDPFNYNVDYGPANNDVRNILNLSGVLAAPWRIQLAPIFSFASGLPYTATTTAAIVPGCPAFYSQCYPVGYSRNSLRGANTILLNARLSKDIGLGEKRSLLLLIEGYNVANHDNFGTNFTSAVTSSRFGQPTGVSTIKRDLQVGARFDF